MDTLDFNIYSLNVNGLCDKTKRCAVLEKLKRYKNSIILLQETHCTMEIESDWIKMWGNKNVFFQMAHQALKEL